MIIDFHTHIFPPNVLKRRDDYARRDPTFAEMYADPKAKIATAEDLLASMDESGVDVSVALGFAWRDHETCVRHNDYLLEAAAKSDGRIVAFVTVNLRDDRAEEEIDRCAAEGAFGLGELRPENQGWELAGDAGDFLASIAEKYGLVLLFHVTEPGDRDYPGRRGCELDRFEAFAHKHDHARIVGAHLGGGIHTDSHGAPDVWVDTAAQPLLYRGDLSGPAIAAVPTERLLLGSGFPLISQKRQIDELRRAITDTARLDAALGGNAKRLLGLNP